MIIVGAGTGRCGTKSLAVLLGVTHEMKPILSWKGDEYFERRLEKWKQQDGVVGDIASVYLPYMEKYDGFKKIILKRDKQDTVDSFMRHSGSFNNWQETGATRPFYGRFFPNYSDELSKREALEKYWEDYYERAEQVAEVFPLETLNSEEGQDKVFSYLEIPNHTHTIPCKYNSS